MTSEIRANTLKNRVGLGTIEYSNTGPVISGVTTASNFKTGSSNLHSSGVEVAGVNVLGADTPIGLGATIYNSGAAVFTGVVTATNFSGSGDLDIDGHTNLDNVSISGVTTTTETIRIGANNKYLKLGASDQLSLVTLGGQSYITNSTGHLTGRSASYTWENFAGNTEYLRIASNGRVGVNTTNPQTTLYSMDEIAAGDGNRRFIGMKARVVDGTPVGEIRTTFYSGASGSYPQMRFVTNDTERIRIDNSGLVGIGTGVPLNRLHVKGSNTVARFESTTSYCDIKLQNSSSQLGFIQYNGTQLRFFANSGSDPTVYMPNGQFGVNTDPSTTLHIKDAVPEIRLTSSDASLGQSEIVGKLSFHTSDPTTPTGAGQVSYIETFSATSNGSDYTTSISNRAGAGGGETKIRLGNALGQIRFYTNTSGNGSERLRINNTGQVIIGSTANTEAGSFTKLSVVGTGSAGSNPSSIQNSTAAVFRMTGATAHASSIAVLAGNTGSSAIHLGDTDNDIIGRILYNHTSSNASDYMAFYVGQDERVRITTQTNAGKIAVNYAATPPSETVMISNAVSDTYTGVTLSHISSGNRYGFNAETIPGNNKGMHLRTMANSSYVTRLRMHDNGVFTLSPSQDVGSSTSFTLALTTNYSSTYPVYTGIAMKNLETGGGNGMCIHTTSAQWDLYTRSGNQSGLSIAHSNVASSSHSRMYITEAGQFCVGPNVYDRLPTARKGNSVFHVAGGGLSVGPKGNTGATKDGGRYVLGWYMVTHNTSSSYTHLITDMWAGGSPHGNNEYIMGGFHIHGHQYSGGQSVSRERIYFHNWSGSYPGYSNSNPGNWSPGNTVYTHSTGYVALRLLGGSYRGYIIDLVQHTWYPTRDINVTSVVQSNNTTE